MTIIDFLGVLAIALALGVLVHLVDRFVMKFKP